MSKQAWERAAGKVAILATVSAIAALAATTSAKAEGGPMPAQQSYAHPAALQAQQQLPQQAMPQQTMPQAIPASAQTWAPAGHGLAPQAGRSPFAQTPIFANTSAMGVTYGPPSYTPPEGFDPSMASSSPLPSFMMKPQLHQAPIQGQWAQPQLPNPAGAPIYGGMTMQPMLPATVSHFAPAEPSYAPAEPLRPNYAAAPAAPATTATYEQIAQPIAQPQAATAYSYEMAPASTPVYVGQSQQIAPSAYATSADPYEVVIGAHQQQAQPSYSSSYQTQGYEMGPVQAAPAYSTATTYGAPAPASYDTTGQAYYQTAPAYDTSSIGYTQPSATTPFSAGNGHFVQVGAFRNIARAERLVRKLQSAGESPIITQANVNGKLFHRVRIPAADKRDASYVRDRIRGLGYYEARIVRG